MLHQRMGPLFSCDIFSDRHFHTYCRSMCALDPVTVVSTLIKVQCIAKLAASSDVPNVVCHRTLTPWELVAYHAVVTSQWQFCPCSVLASLPNTNNLTDIIIITDSSSGYTYDIRNYNFNSLPGHNRAWLLVVYVVMPRRLLPYMELFM